MFILFYARVFYYSIAIFKIKADIRMNKTTLNSQKEKHSMLSLRRATHQLHNLLVVKIISIHALLAESDGTAAGTTTGTV